MILIQCFAVRDGIPYAIDFEIIPDAELTSVAQKTLNGLLKNPQKWLLLLQKTKPGKMNYMGNFMKDAVQRNKFLRNQVHL
jgi:hypothetical protein